MVILMSVAGVWKAGVGKDRWEDLGLVQRKHGYRGEVLGS